MALKPLNSVAGFSVGETPANIILANGDVTTNNITTTGKANLNAIGNVIVSGGSAGQVIQTDGLGNLSFVTINTAQLANGNSNVQVLANGNITFSSAGTANVVVITSTGMNVAGYISGGNITANGNVSVNNYIVTPVTVDLIVAPDTQLTRFYSNVNPFSGGYSLGNNLARWDNIFSNAANVTGNIAAGGLLTNNLYYANGQPWDLQEAAGANKEIQYNDGSNNFGASANFTFDYATNLLTVNGNAQFNNANLGNLAIANFVNVSSNTTTNNLTVNLQLAGNTANFSGNITSLNANLGNLATANFVNVASNTITNNLTVNLALAGNTANFSGNITSLNANLGNLATANFVNVASNLSVNLELSGNTANFSGNITSLNANLGNLATANFVNVSGNINVTDTMQAGNVRTDNLLYANGNPWDLQEAAGANTEIQYNDGSNNFGASANFTYDYVNSNLTVVGNIIATGTFVGNIEGNITISAANTTVLFSDDGVASGNTGFTYDKSNNHVVIDGNLDVNYSINATNLTSSLELSGNTANFTGNINSALNANLGNLVTANFVDVASNVTTNNLTVNSEISGNTANFTGNINSALNANLGNLVTANFVKSAEIYNNSSNVRIDYNSNVTVSVDGYADIFTVSTLGANVTGTLGVSGNITSLNADLGNLATANFVNVSSNTTTGNLSVNLELSGNTANFSGNVIVPNLTVNLELAGNTANFSGNVVAANFIGSLSNGTSNVKVYNNANIEFTINGTANVATISSTGLYVAGEINTTTGNMLSNGNITANLFLNSANANVTGEAVLGSVKTANITAPSGAITISAAGANNNIILSPTGVGNVDVGLHNITQVALPINPNDAATKEYVDNISQGLFIHPAANVTSTTNLSSTYDNGGTVLSATTIAGNKTITFSVNHGLVVDDNIIFTNTFNGIIGGEAYFVYSVPAANQITIKDGYFGAEVTTLVNGTGLTEAALGNGGVGATLTNAGAQAALTIDSILMTVGARVLVQGQTNQFENGIYAVTTVGTGATNWVLTRATDGDLYAPKSETALCSGSYFFIMQGSQYAGSSYVLTSPPGEIVIGVDNIVFSQFSQAGSYTAGNGIAITGTIISANTDNITTAIVSGNIVVKTSANLTTPNIGDATFSSLSWNTLSNGNVTANNLSIGNIANITGNLRVDGIIESNGNVTSNAFINGNNASFTNYANVGGNLLANNITSNNAFSTNTANVTSNLVTGNATVNLEFSGNTANFSGNVIVPNLTVNLQLAGNTANFTGNITSLNANLGNLATANFVNVSSNTTTNNLTVNLALAGNTANFSGNITTLNANLGNLATANFVNVSSNTTTNNLTVNLQLSGNTANFTGNITTLNANLGNLVTANYGNFANDLVVQGNIANANNISVTNLINGNTANFSGNIVAPTVSANTSVLVGDTTITHGNVTTTAVTANQTIASFSVAGVTGVEYLVKAIDASGGKYSVATVLAVTDGTNADYTVYGTTQLGGYTGSLAVNIAGSFIRLQVTPASSNSTVWTTQYRVI